MADQSQNDWCITNRQKFATTLKRLQKAEGVMSLLVVNPKGLVWFTTMENALTALRYCRTWKPFCMRAMSLCRNIDTTDDVVSLMVATKKHELLMVPDEEFILIALQKYGSGEKLYPEFAEGVIDAQKTLTMAFISIVSRILKQEEWISFLNKLIKCQL